MDDILLKWYCRLEHATDKRLTKKICDIMGEEKQSLEKMNR